ncbi:VanZ family protein [Faecalibacterium prausnitzii]|uniref:VanZ family protein n=1 Tax=Faecalibacterium prausnitzii TaxID=853 RepID=UPI001CC186D9|nr:VanZ family protein [Faecalibacterium prausnitzii]
MERYNDTERTSLWVIAGRVVFTVALIACIWFIFSNSMAVATVSTDSSGRVLAWMRIILRRLGQPGLAEHLTMHIVRKLAHFCEYTLEGFCSCSVCGYSRHPLRHITVPMLGGADGADR